MSHIVEIRTELRDALALRAACLRLQLSPPAEGRFQLYSGSVTGLGVNLPGWKYPVVCNPTTGELRYDNYGGQWGAQSQLDRLLQAYSVEKTRLEARRRGHTITEQSLPDGSIRLTLQVGG